MRMTTWRALLCLAAGATLVSCNDSKQSADNSAQPVAPSPAPHPAAPKVEPAKPQNTVALTGYGPLRVGMTVAELKALPGNAKIDRMDPRDPANICGYASLTTYPGLSMMLAGDVVVRMDVAAPDYATVSGARVGMSEAEIKAIYGDALKVQPHPYTGPVGHYLIYHQPKAPLGMIFETDGKKVLNYRVGRWTEVQYVEGCS
ncbi:MAG: hypothetical protein ABI395_02110 [Sphingobium sp.]